MSVLLKRVATIYTGATPPTNNPLYYYPGELMWYTPGDIGSDNIQLSNAEKMISNLFLEEKSSNPYPQGSVLMVGIGATVGKIGYTQQKCYTNQQINVIVFNKKKVLPKYGAYYLLNKSKEINSLTPVVTMKIFNQSKVKQIEFSYPSLVEQSLIVSYLDSKTSAIDSRISLLEQKCEAYERLKKSIINDVITLGLNPDVKMKDSGVEWIGEIPEHWDRCRLKDLGYLYGGLTGKSGDDFRCEDESLTKPFIPFTNILNNINIDFNQFKRVVMEDGEDQNKVRENDILFLMSSEDYESIAKSSVVLGDPGEVYLNSFCRGFRLTKKDILPSFINYQLLATQYRDALRYEGRGFTRINIKIDKIASMFVCIPPLEEQKQLVEHLNDKCAKIDSAISILNAQIDKYKLLKRSLINEVITGQRKVD